MGREVGGRFKRRGHRLIHDDVWQKPTQYCKAIILQLKINFKKAPDKIPGPEDFTVEFY